MLYVSSGSHSTILGNLIHDLRRWHDFDDHDVDDILPHGPVAENRLSAQALIDSILGP